MKIGLAACAWMILLASPAGTTPPAGCSTGIWPVVTLPLDQRDVVLAPDGAGGTYAVWRDLRDFAPGTYAQRLDACGLPLWQANGTLVTTAGVQPSIVSDGAGGLIIVWRENDDIRAQRYHDDGTTAWGAGGVLVAGGAWSQRAPVAVALPSGGAAIAWEDYRAHQHYADIYAQRIGTNGTVQWDTLGIPVSTHASSENAPAICVTTDGSILVAWERGQLAGTDLYAQLLSSSGTARWQENGTAIAQSPSGDRFPEVAPDDAAGGYVGWMNTGANETRVQRVSADGTMVWPSDGVGLGGGGIQQQFDMTDDRSGGIVVTWMDFRETTWDVYGQRVAPSGQELWGDGGLPLDTSAQWDDAKPKVDCGPDGKATIAWIKGRDYGQILSSVVAPDGQIIVSGPSHANTWATEVHVQAGTNRAQFVYEHPTTSLFNRDVLSMVVSTYQTVDVLPPAASPSDLAIQSIRPNPSRLDAWVTFALASDAPATLTVLDIAGRVVREREVGSLGAGSHQLNLGADGRLEPGMYLLRLTQGNSSVTSRMSVVR